MQNNARGGYNVGDKTNQASGNDEENQYRMVSQCLSIEDLTYTKNGLEPENHENLEYVTTIFKLTKKKCGTDYQDVHVGHQMYTC